MLIAFEITAVVLLYLLALCFPGKIRPQWFRGCHRWARAIAGKPWLAISLVFLGAIGIEAGFWLARGFPLPITHDEFSYLLAADTFAHGRLTNPTHPMWRYFETMHVIQQPTYMSKFPPGQGMALAVGQMIFGHPFFGVWLSFAGMCAGICWMLYAWLPRRWAFLGGIMATLWLAMTIWAQSYWGGAVAGLGGALLFGSLPRMVRRPGILPALTCGAGIFVLAITRPYEGLIVCMLAGVALVYGLARRRQTLHLGPILAMGGTLAVLVAVTVAAVAWYNWRVTGSPARMPYRVHHATYEVAPLFLWQSEAKPWPQYRYPEMRAFYVDWNLPRFRELLTLKGFLGAFLTRVWTAIRFFIGPCFAVPVVLVLLKTKIGWMRYATGVCLIMFLALTVTVYMAPHYAAPIVCLVFALALEGFRQVGCWKVRGIAAGRWIPAATALVLLLSVALSVAEVWGAKPRERDRTPVITKLQALPGRHLVIVRYGPKHNPHEEAVYNQADIDSATIVWARDAGPGGNQEILDYFHDRQIWLWQPDEVPPRLSVYPR